MRLTHPWKDILFGQMKETEEAQPIESQDIPDTQSKIQVRFSHFIETGKHGYIKCKSGSQLHNTNGSKFLIFQPIKVYKVDK